MADSVISDKRFTLMLLLYARGATDRLNEPVEGITRVQKLMYLLSKQKIISQVRNLKFEEYAFGPYDSEIYDDLAYLRNMRLLDDGAPSRLSVQDATAEELMQVVNAHTAVPVRDPTEFDEDENVSYDFLMGGIAAELPDRYQTERYSLSALGIKAVEQRLSRVTDPNLPKVLSTIENIKTRFNQMRLRELIQYVYETYPDSAKNSVIADSIRSH